MLGLRRRFVFFASSGIVASLGSLLDSGLISFSFVASVVVLCAETTVNLDVLRTSCAKEHLQSHPIGRAVPPGCQ